MTAPPTVGVNDINMTLDNGFDDDEEEEEDSAALVSDCDANQAANQNSNHHNAAGVADETIATILESMDIGALSDKHNLAVKQSLLLAFLYLVVIASVVLAAVVAAMAEVRERLHYVHLRKFLTFSFKKALSTNQA